MQDHYFTHMNIKSVMHKEHFTIFPSICHSVIGGFFSSVARRTVCLSRAYLQFITVLIFAALELQLYSSDIVQCYRY